MACSTSSASSRPRRFGEEMTGHTAAMVAQHRKSMVALMSPRCAHCASYWSLPWTLPSDDPRNNCLQANQTLSHGSVNPKEYRLQQLRRASYRQTVVPFKTWLEPTFTVTHSPRVSPERQGIVRRQQSTLCCTHQSVLQSRIGSMQIGATV